jgi:glycerol-3-phosphate dehydrogenase (NAD(P)+)
MQFGIIGSGSWATALAKILTDNQQSINWWIRDEEMIKHFNHRHHNSKYLSSVDFEPSRLKLSQSVSTVVEESTHIIVAVPSQYVPDAFESIQPNAFKGRKVISAIKGILPENNQLLNQYLESKYGFSLADYHTVMGPCHAEEIAAERLSYLTFSGADINETTAIAEAFHGEYVNTEVNNDVLGVQYAAVLKNIYALGAGIAHGLEYGDNFLSVLIANCADEMAGFLRKVGIPRIEVGIHDSVSNQSLRKSPNYAASVYLGDLLVTCYSLYSRNRTFGNMIGKGYSVRSAQLELNMVAEGYRASRSMFEINKQVGAEMPIAETVYRILWENVKPKDGYRQIEEILV